MALGDVMAMPERGKIRIVTGARSRVGGEARWASGYYVGRTPTLAKPRIDATRGAGTTLSSTSS